MASKKKFTAIFWSAIGVFALLLIFSIVMLVQNMSLTNQVKKLTSEAASLTTNYNEINGKYKKLQKQLSVQNTSFTDAGSNGNKKMAYLTFDDGPSKYTEKLLAALKSCKVNATFFVIGLNCQKYPNAIKEEAADGNVVGIHSWTHKYSYIYANINNFMTDFNELKDYLTTQLGKAPTVCRFPGGTNNTVSLRYGGNIMRTVVTKAQAEGIKNFDWNADAGDAEVPIPTKDKVVSNIIKDVGKRNNVIILCHDFGNRTSTIEAIPEVVSKLRAMGYSFGLLAPNVKGIEFKPAA